MEEPKAINPLRRLAADSGTGRNLTRRVHSDSPAMEEDASPEVARENIVRDMMRIFDGLMGCTPKRGGNSLAFLDRKNKPVGVLQLPKHFVPAPLTVSDVDAWMRIKS